MNPQTQIDADIKLTEYRLTFGLPMSLRAALEQRLERLRAPLK